MKVAHLSEPAEERVVFRDGLGVREWRDAGTGERVEWLHLDPAFAAVELPLRDRVARLAKLQHVKFARILSLEPARKGKGPILVSSHVAGHRLSEVLEMAGHGMVTFDPGAGLQVTREVLAALAVLHDSRNVTHGALGPERVVLTATGRVVMVEHVLAHALDRLQLPRHQLWRDWRIATPPAAGPVRFDIKTDIAQAGVLALGALLGRPLEDQEYPHRLRGLLPNVQDRLARSPAAAIAGDVVAWLERLVPVDGRRAFGTVREAQQAYEVLVSRGASAMGVSLARVKGVMAAVSAIGAASAPTAPAPTPAPASEPAAPEPLVLAAAQSDGVSLPAASAEPDIDIEALLALEAELEGSPAPPPAAPSRVEPAAMPDTPAASEGLPVEAGGLDAIAQERVDLEKQFAQLVSFVAPVAAAAEAPIRLIPETPLTSEPLVDERVRWSSMPVDPTAEAESEAADPPPAEPTAIDEPTPVEDLATFEPRLAEGTEAAADAVADPGVSDAATDDDPTPAFEFEPIVFRLPEEPAPAAAIEHVPADWWREALPWRAEDEQAEPVVALEAGADPVVVFEEPEPAEPLVAEDKVEEIVEVVADDVEAPADVVLDAAVDAVAEPEPETSLSEPIFESIPQEVAGQVDVEVTDAIEAIEAIDAIEAVEAIEAIEPIEPIEPIETTETIEAVEAITQPCVGGDEGDSIRGDDVVEAADGIEIADAVMIPAAAAADDPVADTSDDALAVEAVSLDVAVEEPILDAPSPNLVVATSSLDTSAHAPSRFASGLDDFGVLSIEDLELRAASIAGADAIETPAEEPKDLDALVLEDASVSFSPTVVDLVSHVDVDVRFGDGGEPVDAEAATLVESGNAPTEVSVDADVPSFVDEAHHAPAESIESQAAPADDVPESMSEPAGPEMDDDVLPAVVTVEEPVAPESDVVEPAAEDTALGDDSTADLLPEVAAVSLLTRPSEEEAPRDWRDALLADVPSDVRPWSLLDAPASDDAAVDEGRGALLSAPTFFSTPVPADDHAAIEMVQEAEDLAAVEIVPEVVIVDGGHDGHAWDHLPSEEPEDGRSGVAIASADADATVVAAAPHVAEPDDEDAEEPQGAVSADGSISSALPRKKRRRSRRKKGAAAPAPVPPPAVVVVPPTPALELSRLPMEAPPVASASAGIAPAPPADDSVEPVPARSRSLLEREVPTWTPPADLGALRPRALQPMAQEFMPSASEGSSGLDAGNDASASATLAPAGEPARGVDSAAPIGVSSLPPTPPRPTAQATPPPVEPVLQFEQEIRAVGMPDLDDLSPKAGRPAFTSMADAIGPVSSPVPSRQAPAEPWPAAPAPAPSRGMNWRRLIAASVLIALFQGAAFAAWWWVQPGASGTLVVQTAQDGVEVLIDGKVIGRTPFRDELAPGRHKLVLRQGDQVREMPVEISLGVVTTQALDWPASDGTAKGSLQVTSTPAGAEVLIDGKSRGKAPLLLDGLPAGKQELTLRGDAGSVTVVTTVIAGETTPVEVPIFAGWILVDAPVELSLVFNREKIGSSMDGQILMPPGTHRVRAVSEALGINQSFTVTVEPGEVKRVTVRVPSAPLQLQDEAGTEVFVDGDRLGALPSALRIPVGTHDVLIRRPDGSERRQTVTVRQGDTVSL